MKVAVGVAVGATLHGVGLDKLKFQDVFGDPLFPTAVYNPDLGFEPLRECYVFTESCADEPQVANV